jgi:NADPH2:quinone reductase
VRALTIKDNELIIVERDMPEPGPLDVVVAVRTAGINAADLMQRQGFYPAPAGSPADIPGMELAGIVSAVGNDVDPALLGRRVCALVGGGAQATHCVVASDHLLFVPESASWDEAGSFPEAFATAHDALVTQGGLAANERALISGAAGGVGVAGVQIAHALGATVVAMTRDSAHHEKLRALGADETITLDELNDHERVDVVLELLGAVSFSVVQKHLNPHGRVVVIGVGTGARVEIDLLTMMTTRSTITGSTLRSRSRQEKAEVTTRVQDELVPRWAKRELSAPIARTFEFDDAVDAYDYFARPGKFGKVVLRISNE